MLDVVLAAALLLGLAWWLGGAVTGQLGIAVSAPGYRALRAAAVVAIAEVAA